MMHFNPELIKHRSLLQQLENHIDVQLAASKKLKAKKVPLMEPESILEGTNSQMYYGKSIVRGNFRGTGVTDTFIGAPGYSS